MGDKIQKQCLVCKKIIIEDWEKYLEKNPNVMEIECPYCGYVENRK